MNKTQIQTTLASLIGVVAGYAAGHGWLGLSVSDWTTLLTAIGTIGVVAWSAVITRPQALKDTTGHLLNTTVVTDKASADALPNNKDVVAVTPAIADAIKKAG